MNREVLHIGVSGNEGTRVLRLIGELDAYTSNCLTNVERMWINGAEKILVNLDALEYIDSSGLSALVGMWVKITDNGARMVVSCRNPRIHRVLEITGLLNLFDLESTGIEAKSPAGQINEIMSSGKSPQVRMMRDGKR